MNGPVLRVSSSVSWAALLLACAGPSNDGGSDPYSTPPPSATTGSAGADSSAATATPTAPIVVVQSGGEAGALSGSAGAGPGSDGGAPDVAGGAANAAGADAGAAGGTPTAGGGGTPTVTTPPPTLPTAPTTAVTPSPTPTPPPATTPATGGTTGATAAPAPFLTSGTLQGYAWTSTGGGATITPVEAGSPLCASGNVPVTDTWAGTAMVGWNIAQESASSVVGTTTPTGTGLTVNVSNPGGSLIRVQVQAADGATVPEHRWCTELATFDSDVEIPWASFDTQCWEGGTGTAYAMEPIAAVVVLVPGMGTTDPGAAARPFDFCLNGAGLGGATFTEP